MGDSSKVEFISTEIILESECVVNFGNSTFTGCNLKEHPCLDYYVHMGAGNELVQECTKIMNDKLAKIGKCIITKGYKLPFPFIIHTYGPSQEIVGKRIDLLILTIHNCLNLANEKNLKSLVFPLIYPKDMNENVLKIFNNWFDENIATSIEKVYLVDASELCK